jgi:hypothetical protein
MGQGTLIQHNAARIARNLSAVFLREIVPKVFPYHFPTVDIIFRRLGVHIC